MAVMGIGFIGTILSETLFSVAQTAALAPRKEMPSLIPGTSSRQADVYLPIWTRGNPATLDVHVISTLQQLTLKEAATTPYKRAKRGKELPILKLAIPWAVRVTP